MKDLKRKDLKKPKRSEKQTVKSRECICQIKEDLAPKEHPKKNKTETLLNTGSASSAVRV